MKEKPYLADIGMLLITIIWGYGFIATKVAIDYISASQLTFYRFVISAVIMCIIFHKQLKAVKKEEIRDCIILGLMLCVGFLLQTIALNYTTVAKNAFLTTLNVIIVPIIVAVIHKKRIDQFSIFGCVLAVIGTGILSLNTDFTLNLGDLLSILCAVFFSFHIFLQGEYVQRTRASVLVTGQIVFSAIFSGIWLALIGEMRLELGNAKAVMGILYLAFMSTCLCFFVQAYCQKFTSPIKAVIIFSLEAVFASVFAVIIFKDAVTPRFLIGSTCIFVAVIISSTKLAFLKRESRG